MEKIFDTPLNAMLKEIFVFYGYRADLKMSLKSI